MVQVQVQRLLLSLLLEDNGGLLKDLARLGLVDPNLVIPRYRRQLKIEKEE